MFDTARIETSLETKRQELASKVAEGRNAIEMLVKRHAEMGRRIEQATTVVGELEQQLRATNIVIDMFDREELILVREPAAPSSAPPATPPDTPRHAARQKPAGESQPDNFRPLTYLRCLREGHDMVFSRQSPGKVTCQRCRVRRDI